ncbi:MAG TPA: alpha/beta hydrolase, partial [Pseudomonas sp.]|nr:alpha/beta hydrolase [Pseudomonas sp.]
GALPDRVSHLALIDGVLPPTSGPQDAAERLGMALAAQLRLETKRKTVYSTLEEGIQARMKGMVAVTREAAELLAQRGLMPVAGGYSWRSDSRLTLPSPTRLSEDQAMAFVRRIGCPVRLVVAREGLLARHASLLEQLPFGFEVLPGGHHLHLNDEEGATLVADCFNPFLGFP